jgi:hypothetical protein
VSPVNFAEPSERYYGAEIDLEPITVVDLGQGSVTDGAIVDGGLDGSSLIRAGTLPPSSFDTTPPLLPSDFLLTNELAAAPDGGTVPAIVVTLVPPVAGWDADYFGTYVYTTNESDNDPVTPAPVWTRPIVTFIGKGIDVGSVVGVAGGTLHWVYVRTVDTMGNYSIPSVTKSITTLADTEAPGIPQSVAAAGGFKAIGVRWSSSNPSDLMSNEVRYAPDSGGAPNTSLWLVRRTRGNSVYLDDLGPGLWWAQVRAVDFSKNVMARWSCTGLASTDVITCVDHGFTNGQAVRFEDFTGAPEIAAVSAALYVINATATTFQVSLTLGGAALNFTTNLVGFVGFFASTAVSYLSDGEAGWSPLTSATATLVGGSDLAVGSIIAGIISAGYIDASTIQTGMLNINTGAGAHADGIQILYGAPAVVVGKWDENGLEVRSKTAGRSLLDFIRLDDAQLSVYKDGGLQAAINRDGINATAITFGVSPGGHNLVFNSSFELAKFVATSTSTIGTGGSTLAGGVGGWVLVTNTNATLAAALVTMATL